MIRKRDETPAPGRARSNEDWLRALRREGPEQSTALEALREYLLRALPGALAGYGRIPDHLIEDVAQEAMVRVLGQLDRFEGRSRFTTWATTIAVRLALTELRRRRWQDVSLEDVSGGDEETFSREATTGWDDPEQHAARADVLRALREALARDLTERQRIAIVAELRGMPQEEIGRRLGSTRNAIYKLGHDARKKLKLGLEASGFDAEQIRAAFS